MYIYIKKKLTSLNSNQFLPFSFDIQNVLEKLTDAVV